MDSRLELCFAIEEDPYIPPRKMSQRELNIRNSLAPSHEQFDIMWKRAENWRVARLAAWNRVKDNRVTL